MDLLRNIITPVVIAVDQLLATVGLNAFSLLWIAAIVSLYPVLVRPQAPPARGRAARSCTRRRRRTRMWGGSRRR